ncbi:uncharacterized protein LOC133200868 [Saccostrea echinata]|uniref:uncharacterized protein LOC133200868 n=1 Tax=Saccostrea echinata TaxID=191078 RepID=UPI002A81B8DA|nr:uncharacterized protein LOC133200868 [Saccostrea echinata]
MALQAIASLVLLSFILLPTLCQNTEEDEDMTYAFEPEERFLDIFPLTEDNFTDSVMRSSDAWIVIFHAGQLKRSWKSMAVNLRGVVWVGMVDTRYQAELLERMKYRVNHDSEARVYPHGPMSIKKKSWLSAKSPNEARMLAVDSIPDNSLRIKGKNLQEYLVDCFMSKPSRFPLLLLTEETETPVLFKAVSYRFKRYFNAARVVKPTLDDYNALGMEDSFFDTPLLFILLPDVKDKGTKKTQDLGFSAVMFETKRMGDLNYPNILRFLFGVNNSYRHTLPGDNQSNDQEVSEMSDIVKIESKRFEMEKPKKKAKKDDDSSIKFTMTNTMSGAVRDEL